MNELGDLLDSTATEIAAAVRAGDVSAREVAHESLVRAESEGARVGAFVRTTPELALAQARALDAALTQARRDGVTPADLADRWPLAGVPCPIKDLNAVAGVGMSAGSALLAAQPLVPEVDDGTVTLLRAAGTTMIGKTTTPEFGFPPYTEPRIGPGGSRLAARTPWDLRRGAGGSSGGAAAAVASGVTPIAQGSDGGGSLRIPAAACGVVGFKPSRGVVSNGPVGIDGPGLATQGAVARTVADAALALRVLAGPWPGEAMPFARPRWGDLAAASPDALRARWHAALGRMPRIGLLTVPVVVPDAPVHPAARAAAERAAGVLASAGMSVGEAPAPMTEQEWEAFMPLWSVGALTLPVPPEAVGMLEPLTQWLREVGARYSGADYAAAVALGQQIARSTARAWEEFDLVITPTLAVPPPLVGAIRDDADPAADFAAQKALTPWTSPANITGRPSVSLPVHREVVEGAELPFGAMLTGRLGEDGLLLEVARLVELADPWPAAPRRVT